MKREIEDSGEEQEGVRGEMKMRVKGKVCPLFLSCRLHYNCESVARPELRQKERAGRAGERGKETLQDVSRARWDNVCTQSAFDAGGEKRMMQERMKRIVNGKIEERAPLERGEENIIP